MHPRYGICWREFQLKMRRARVSRRVKASAAKWHAANWPSIKSWKAAHRCLECNLHFKKRRTASELITFQPAATYIYYSPNTYTHARERALEKVYRKIHILARARERTGGWATRKLIIITRAAHLATRLDLYTLCTRVWSEKAIKIYQSVANRSCEIKY